PATATPIIASRCMISAGRAGNGPAPCSTRTLPPRTCAEAISTATVRQTLSPSAAPPTTLSGTGPGRHDRFALTFRGWSDLLEPVLQEKPCSLRWSCWILFLHKG